MGRSIFKFHIAANKYCDLELKRDIYKSNNFKDFFTNLSGQTKEDRYINLLKSLGTLTNEELEKSATPELKSAYKSVIRSLMSLDYFYIKCDEQKEIATDNEISVVKIITSRMFCEGNSEYLTITRDMLLSYLFKKKDFKLCVDKGTYHSIEISKKHLEQIVIGDLSYHFIMEK